MSDVEKKDLRKSVIMYLNKKHGLDLNPDKKAISAKPTRDSDVPLFSPMDHQGIGMEIKTTYNRCINLLTFKPDKLEEHPFAGTTLEKDLVQLIKDLKEEKKNYSSIWKKDFDKFAVKNKVKVKYNESLPFSEEWMHHVKLQKSPAMEIAALKYFAVAKEILKKMLAIKETVTKGLAEASKALSLSLDQWEEDGKKDVESQLKGIQKDVDIILATEWANHVRPLIKDQFTRYKDVKPSYIGSTNTGQKSITKAYIQFYPGKFDVDGQIISKVLYHDLATLGLSASKNRFFVAEVFKGVKKAWDNSMNGKGPATQEKAKEMTGIVELVYALQKFNPIVYGRLCNEVDGIDKNDEFDIAIVEK
ncbi:MAG: hypothetical protein AB8E82_11410 [Aureispira sp.]